LVCSIVGAMTLQVLIVALVFASSQVHVNCNAVLKSNEPKAENDSASTCSGASAACVHANFEAGRKKGSANVLLQSQSDMKSRGNKTKSCEYCIDGCWDFVGKYTLGGPSVAEFEGVSSLEKCITKCEGENNWLDQVLYTPASNGCSCTRASSGYKLTAMNGARLYEKDTTTACTTTTTTTTTTPSRRRRSCAASNDCVATSDDPTCGNECEEYATAGTCCQTCDTTSDARRRDSRRRRDSNGKGYLCQRRRG